MSIYILKKTNEYLNRDPNYSLELFFNYFLLLFFCEYKDFFINKRAVTINFL